jgi:tRNA A37 threonylcarbamoyladenosine biosynthesis protein TsaE
MVVLMIGPSDALATDWIASYPPARSLSLDQEALRVYERAYYIGAATEKPGDPPISFTTAMAALFLSEDAASQWFSQQAQALGPFAESVFSEKNINPQIKAGAVQQSGRPDEIRLSGEKQLLTVSARTVLQNAENWAQHVGGSDIGVRHLVAAYVINPPVNHRTQLAQWGWKEVPWRTVFFEWVARMFTWEAWESLSQRPAPSRGVPIFEQVHAKGSSLSWRGDASAMDVLEQAARDHGRRDDKWLRTRTLLFALFESAERAPIVQDALAPLWQAAVASQFKYRELAGTYFVRPAPLTVSLFDDLDLSPRVLTALDTARELASFVAASPAGTEERPQISPLHLAGGLLSRRVDAEDEFAALGLDPHALREDFVLHAKRGGESEEIWREILGLEETLPVNRPVELNSDEPEAVIRADENWQSDPLHIRADVEAFASLLASKTLEPPLSIGLFGPWGSGKTTFLKRLRRAVDRRTSDARTKPGSPEQAAYVQNVVHVEFNAWHYSEDALVSSLIDAIFRKLDEYIADDRIVAGKQWREQKLTALASTQRAVEAANEHRAAAEAAVNARAQELAKEQANAAQQLTRVGAVMSTAWALAKQDLANAKVVKESGILESVPDALANATELRTRLEHMRDRPARLLHALGPVRSVSFAATVLALPPLIAWVVAKTLHLHEFGELLSFAGTLISVVGLWLRSAAVAAAKVDTAITSIADAFDQKVAKAAEVQAAQGELQRARAQAETAAAGLEAARGELARAQTDVANAALPLQMLRLVSGRNEDQSYRKELTTLSLARADLETLSTLLRDQSSATPAETGTSGKPARAVDRVVLYIDDLDRCRPEDVVRVLQVAHMLLAFELFVVVIAVDVRWVEEALRRSYGWLEAPGSSPVRKEQADPLARSEDHSSGVTPQDYLEKIFQIAFWLEPMTTSKAADFIGSLVRKPFREAPGSSGYESLPGTPDSLATISITALELDYMRALAAYVGPSPRRVKRLVNAYRLIKARMSDAQLASLLTDRSDGGELRSGPYQIVIALLVIGTGAQAEAARILNELAEWDPKGTYEDVVNTFGDRDHAEWKVAARVLETLMNTQKAKDVSELRGWARKVGRFVLHGSVGPVVRESPKAVTDPARQAAKPEGA